MKTKHTVILSGPGFEDIEGLYPYYRLQEAGCVVDVATSSDAEVLGKHGLSLTPTIKLAELTHRNFDTVIVPGGLEGPDRVRQQPHAVEFVRSMYAHGKLVSSICHGPWVLISAGIMKGKRATCYIGMKDDLINAGATYTGEPVTVDGHLITADHPRSISLWMKHTVTHIFQ